MLLKTCVLVLCSVTAALQTCFHDESKLVSQEPAKLLAHPGETAIINCTVTTNKEINQMYLRKRFQKIIVFNAKGCKVNGEYQNRLTCSGQVSDFTVILKNLTESDSDFYICDGFIGGFEEIHGQGTLIFVRAREVIKGDDKTEEEAHKPQYFAPIIITVTACFCMLLAIIAFVRYKKMEKLRKNQSSTYVDMTQTLRRNTMANDNTYCRR